MQTTHDASFDIAIGGNRKEINWKNREMLWSEFLEKLKTTQKTHETYKEYLAAKKSRQDEIKDVGGFVGGYLSSGRRKSGNVVHRQLITLDIDFAKPGIWDDFILLYDCAAVMYSTHKHCADSPRLRLIMPLSRPVMPDEYIAISRRIAGVLGIENFDHTTFEPSRLMYWPSTAKDAEYLFEYQDGPWLDADAVLGSYHNWQDASEWPVSDRYNTIIQNAIKKQGDPLEKPGVIGAFCRTYSIEEAIDTFLSDAYDACDTPGRYTYKEGSTAAGLVIYEDKYAYSHHGTDPVSGKLCNAFDLVRLHKFGLKDEDAREGTPGNKLPSYTEMMDFATRDVRVRKLLGAERLQEAHADFEDLPDDEEISDEWLADMDVDRKGNYHSTINNVSLILENDPYLKNCFGKDEFRQRKVILKNLPWRKVTAETRFLKDEDEQNLVKYLEKTYNITSRANIKDAFDIHIDAHGFHPVRDYLKANIWDGVERVDSLFIDYMGADDNAYIRAVTRKTLVAAVARIFQPGIKFDYVLTFIGEEGLGKSSLVSKLAGPWFSDSFSFNMLHSKEAYEQLQGAWLIEIAELTGMKKVDVEAAKQFISKQEDSFRAAYARNSMSNKRQCVFFASTNNWDFLRGSTGNRRFWPVSIYSNKPKYSVFADLTQAEINRVWAEAVHLYKQGETLYLSAELEAVARTVQSEHTEKDERAVMIQRYLDTLLPADWDDRNTYERRAWLAGNDELQPDGIVTRIKVCAAEIWCEVFEGREKDMSTHNTKFIHDIMRTFDGWEAFKSKSTFKGFGNQRGYFRKRDFAGVYSEKTPTCKNQQSPTTTTMHPQK